VELPVDTPAAAPSTPQPDIGWAGAFAIAIALLYTLTLAAGGGYVFYASIRPASVDAAFGAPFIDLPYALLGIAWAVGPVALLITGLPRLHQIAPDNWRPAAAWVGAVAAGTAIGYLIVHGYGLLVSASRNAPGGSAYWQVLIATAGQLAIGVAMIALLIPPNRKGATAVTRKSG